MKKFIPLFLLLVVIGSSAEAQFTRYIVRFKNKGGGNPYTFAAPQNYLSARAILRRTKYTIPIDSADLPVTPAYVTQVRNVANVTVLNISKWMNAITIQTTDAAAITTINGFSFVQSVTGMAARPSGGGRGNDKFEPVSDAAITPQRPGNIEADYYNYGTTSFNEIHLHNGEFLHNIGLRGQTMQIAMLDNGFNNYLTLRAFDSINAESRVLGTWDFVARNATVSDDGSHGMNCFSIIGANIPGTMIGKCPKAGFWLFQTEDNASEYPIEEFNWVCGAERADSSGADVISSSLGYNTFDNASLNHTYADMNGNTTIAANGADMAVKKGILTFLAAGNEGTNSWHYIITAADGDSVVAVGAVNSAGAVGSFSSYGPSSDGQIKPDLASVGVSALIQNTNNTVGQGNGTSFACPNMAGMGTCLWMGFPEYNNMKILDAMKRAGSRYSNPDDRVGYGIPNMKTAFGILLTQYATSTSSITGCQATISWNSKDVNAMKYEIERKGPSDPGYTKVGEVNPIGGVVLSNQSYQFQNNLTSGSSGTYSYRIRQIIDTASATFTAVYIDTTNLIISSPCIVTGVGNVDPNKILVRVEPNPVQSSTITLRVETPNAITSMTILVYDTKGALMLKVVSSKGAGKKMLDIPAAKLSKGKYFVKVLDGQKTVGVAEMLRL